MWSEQSAKDRQPYEQKPAKLKEKFKKDIAAYWAKSRSEVGEKDPGRPTGSKKKNEPEDEEEEEEEDDDEEEEGEDEEERLSCKDACGVCVCAQAIVGEEYGFRCSFTIKTIQSFL